jgi:hypothetical protein
MFENEQRSACEYTIFEAAQLLRNSHKQWPSNQGDPDSSVIGEAGRVYYTAVNLLMIPCLYRSMCLLLGCVLNRTNCTSQSPTPFKCQTSVVSA